MHKHSSKEVILKVFLHGSSLHLMQSKSLSLSNKSIEDVAKSLRSKFFIVSITSSASNSDLLPLLESFCKVKELHSIAHSEHHLVSILLIVQVLFPGIQQFGKSVLSEFVDHLLISSSQIQGQLSSGKPFLDGSL